VPAQWSALINRFTQTESYVEVYKNYDITGPVSTGLKQIYDWLFPLALGIYVIYGFLMLLSVKTPEIKQKLLIGLSLGYVYTFMFFAKVLSTPFLLWQIPLIAVLPVKNWKQHLSWTIPATVMIIISMTKIPNWELGLINIHLLIGLTRVFLIAFLLIRTIGWVHETISDRPRIQRS